MKKKISKKIPCCSECDFTTGHITCKSLQDINNSKVVKFTAFQDEQTVLCRLWWPSPASWQHQALRVCPQRRCTDDDLLNGLHTGPSHQGSQSHSEYKLTPGRTKVRSSLSGSQSAVWDLNIPVGTRNWTRFHIRTCLPLVYFLWFLTSDNTSTWLLLWLWFCHVSDFLFRVLLLHWCSVPHFYFWLIDTAIFIFGKRRFSLHPTTCQIVATKKKHTKQTTNLRTTQTPVGQVGSSAVYRKDYHNTWLFLLPHVRQPATLQWAESYSEIMLHCPIR